MFRCLNAGRRTCILGRRGRSFSSGSRSFIQSFPVRYFLSGVGLFIGSFSFACGNILLLCLFGMNCAGGR